MNVRGRQRTRWIALAMGVAIAAVAGGWALLGRADAPPGAAVGYVPLPTVTPTPRHPLEFSLPGGVTGRSTLVMVQGGVARRLTVWEMNRDAPPLEVDRGVHLFPLLPDPSGTRVLYSAGRAVMVLDVPARRARIIGEMPPGGQILAAQWSPGAQMIAYIVQLEDERVAYLAWQDASQPARVMLRTPGRLPVDVGWLPDGRPVTILMGIGPVGGLQARYLMYDWLRDERVMLPADTRPIQPYAPWRSPDGSRQLYLLPDWYARRTSSQCTSGAVGLAGAEWLYVAAAGSGPAHAIAFEQDQVFLDHPTWLQDGRVLLRGMSSAACPQNGSGLYLGEVDGSLSRLVAAQMTFDPQQTDVMTGVAYALSPDERVVVWADTDLAARRSTIYRTVVESGQTEVLYQTPAVDNDHPLAFKDDEMIVHLVWLP